MPVNNNQPHLWKADVAQSVDMYNKWFMQFAPKAFRDTRVKTTQDVEATLKSTGNMSNIQPAIMRAHPEILPTLRMSTCPPLAVDRLVGLADVSKNLVGCMEEGKLPKLMKPAALDADLKKIANTIMAMVDPDIFVWIGRSTPPTKDETYRAATIVADRLCGAVANPIIRNAQEARQLAAIGAWLTNRKYKTLPTGSATKFTDMPAGTFTFRLNVPVSISGTGAQAVNIPIDAVVMPHSAKKGDFPLLIEAKSAGDFTNTNKRRKEEAMKMNQLRSTYGSKLQFILFLCGYFDGGYLGYEAQEGIDWVWEHRIDDLAQFGL